MFCNVLKRENYIIERNNIIKSGFFKINFKIYIVYIIIIELCKY